jgi:DNA-binding MarR family transcriptional regulator
MGRDNGVIAEALTALVTLAVRHRSRGVSLTAASTLARLERTGPRRLTDLAISEGVTQPSMTALVSQLEGLGYAERRRDPGDGRVVLVAITRAGRGHVRSLRQESAAAFSVLMDKLGDDDLAALSAALPALRRLLDLEVDAGTGAEVGVA